MFVSGGQDKTARFWDLRASTPITCVPSPTGNYNIPLFHGFVLPFTHIMLIDKVISIIKRLFLRFLIKCE